MVFSVRPEIKVIMHHHRPGCRFAKTRREEDCKCNKYFYITAAKGEKYRVSAKTASWELARIRAHQWEERLDPNPAPRPAESQHQIGGVIRRIEQLEKDLGLMHTVLHGGDGQDAPAKSPLSKPGEKSNHPTTSTHSDDVARARGFGPHVHKLRAEKGWSLRQMAKSCGMPHTNIHQFEIGLKNPRLKELEKIASGVGLSLMAFLRPLYE
jgi:DNA-binding XRE family transcriptional regulator